MILSPTRTELPILSLLQKTQQLLLFTNTILSVGNWIDICRWCYVIGKRGHLPSWSCLVLSHVTTKHWKWKLYPTTLQRERYTDIQSENQPTKNLPSDLTSTDSTTLKIRHLIGCVNSTKCLIYLDSFMLAKTVIMPTHSLTLPGTATSLTPR